MSDLIRDARWSAILGRAVWRDVAAGTTLVDPKPLPRPPLDDPDGGRRGD